MRDRPTHPASVQPLQLFNGASGDIAPYDARYPNAWLIDHAMSTSSGDNRVGDEASQTHVTVVWQKGQREEWLKFGKPVASRIIDRSQRTESYLAGDTFGLVGWAANEFGTARSALYIVRAAGATERVIPVPQVDPGGDLLLSVHGWSKVVQVLRLIDAIAASAVDPCDVAPDYWRHIHNRIAAREKPRCYSHALNRGWLQRIGKLS